MVPLQTPRGEAKVAPGAAQTLYLLKFLAAGCVLPGCVARGWQAALAVPRAQGTAAEITAAYLPDKAPDLLSKASRALGTGKNLGDPLAAIFYLQGKEFINVPLPR